MSGKSVENVQHDELLMRVVHMTRLLHDSLRGLGLDKLLERAAEDIPDARDRLIMSLRCLNTRHSEF